MDYFKAKTELYFRNSYIDDYVLEDFFINAEAPKNKDIEAKFKKIWEGMINHDEEYLKSLSEADIRDKIINPILQILGFTYRAEVFKKSYGSEYKPDYVLFPNQYTEEKFTRDKKNIEYPMLLLEAKKFNVNFTSGTRKDTAEKQLIDYTLYSGLPKGILCNGRYWHVYDTSDQWEEPRIIGVDIFKMFSEYKPDIFSWQDFYNIFKAKNFESKELWDILDNKTVNSKNELKENIRNFLYGEKSILEEIGTLIYKKHREAKAEDVYQNALVLLFRLIFMAFYEKRYENYLLNYRSFNLYSIYQIYNNIEKQKVTYKELLNIWGWLDKGDVNHKIPMLNGGLFNFNEAPLINDDDLISDETLIEILKSLITGRDYRTLSVKELGDIYEGLLTYEFKIAKTDIYLIRYDEKKGKQAYTFVDDYEKSRFQRLYEKTFAVEKEYKRGDIYLTSYSNQRKTTASYYTPDEFTNYMVKEAINSQLKMGVKVLDLKIIDNACGSGHFLVAALNYLSKICLEQDIYYKQIEQELTAEKTQIIKNIKDFIDNEAMLSKLIPTDSQILKRLLLKKVIYGIDLNKIAVEITKVALWIETFIFATPLSFIEHHIKCGNSLLFTTIDEFKKFENKHIGTDLFNQDRISVEKLENAFKIISNLNDNTKENIEKSKKEYAKIEPILKEYNNHLNTLNYVNFKLLDKLYSESKRGQVVEILNDKTEAKEEFIQTYKPFNIEIEFPDVKEGFNVVLGNPPWDKVKLGEDDFYRTYQSDYKVLSHSEKDKVKYRLKSSIPNIEAEFNTQKQIVKNINEYYKHKYPFNRGSGDSNLFQYFIERNLSLLSENGTMFYLTPSVWSFADSGLNIRKHILENYNLKKFFAFVNWQKLFDIHRSYKFCIFELNRKTPHDFANIVAKSTPPQGGSDEIRNNSSPLEGEAGWGVQKPQSISCFFMESSPNRLNKPETHLNITIDEIKRYSPEHLSILEFSGQDSKNIVTKAYSKFKAIDSNYIKFTNELDMTADKGMMWELKTEKEKRYPFIPMFEGKCIHQFNAKFTEINYWADSTKIPNKNHLNYRLSVRSIASNQDMRSCIACILPKVSTAGNSLHISIPTEHTSISRLLLTQAILNSIIADYVLRLYVDINVNMTYLKRLPIPQPSDDEINENVVYKELVYNSAMLSYLNAPKYFSEFKELFKLKTTKYPKTPDAQIRFKHELQAKNDKLIFELYNINKQEIEVILEQFKVLQTKQPWYISLLRKK